MFGVNMQFLVDKTIDFEAMRTASLTMIRTALEVPSPLPATATATAR